MFIVNILNCYFDKSFKVMTKLSDIVLKKKFFEINLDVK